MAEFTCTGEVTLHGVTFFIEAESATEARFKAERGEYVRYETDGAEAVDWSLHPPVQPNT